MSRNLGAATCLLCQLAPAGELRDMRGCASYRARFGEVGALYRVHCAKRCQMLLHCCCFPARRARAPRWALEGIRMVSRYGYLRMDKLRHSICYLLRLQSIASSSLCAGCKRTNELNDGGGVAQLSVRERKPWSVRPSFGVGWVCGGMAGMATKAREEKGHKSNGSRVERNGQLIPYCARALTVLTKISDLLCSMILMVA